MVDQLVQHAGGKVLEILHLELGKVLRHGHQLRLLEAGHATREHTCQPNKEDEQDRSSNDDLDKREAPLIAREAPGMGTTEKPRGARD
jgi:hypothetical protein